MNYADLYLSQTFYESWELYKIGVVYYVIAVYSGV